MSSSANSKDNPHNQDVDHLISLLPKDKLTEEFTPQFKLLFVKALSKGFSIEYIALAITYTIDHSKGSIFEFKSYLGKTLDNNYHAGYVSKHEALRIKQEKQRQAEADRITRERLKAQKEREELEQIRIENESRQQALESLKALNPDRYREVQYQALDILERQRPTYRYDANGAFVKAQMSIILGL
ncbi:MAG: hypothetical protein HQK63_16610 [Desulfamplus sp.]|nr:hypothetical protein [Desulfamplus sp.]